MAKKAGRPPGAQNKVGKDEKEFIKGLLGDTQEQFRKEFLRMARACDAEKPDLQQKIDKIGFLKIRQEMMKMIVPKPVEIDASMNESQFAQLMGKAAAWDDDLD